MTLVAVDPQHSGGQNVARSLPQTGTVHSRLILPEDAAGGYAVAAVRQAPPMETTPAITSDTVAAGEPLEAPRPRIYTVEPNDSLRKIARKLYGPQHEEQYGQIFEANRHILHDEEIVFVGQKLTIPPLPGAQPVARSASDAGQQRYREMDLAQIRKYFDQAQTTQPPVGRIYVVRQGDNLTRIARRVLHDDSRQAVMKIYNANRDTLTSPHVLPVGAELKIPS